MGDARVRPRTVVRRRGSPDVGDELAVPQHELLTVALARDTPPALRERLWWCERAQAVQTLPLVQRRCCARVPLPGIGEGGGGVVVRVDAGEGVAEVGQAGGEVVGLFEGEGGDTQAAGRCPEEGRADLARPLQQAEGGGTCSVRVPACTQCLRHRQRDGVQGGARPQETSGASEEVVEVFGEVPVIRTHAP